MSAHADRVCDANDRLVQELAALREALQKSMTGATKLARENDELREDKARIDWLENNWFYLEKQMPYATTVRAAIDAARKVL